ncbi:T9SS type A sorting domain-containing protein [Hymenobacter tibetensis]|uniref:T9SS type A sorting domain-containing protein n=1 Tax=Hymenobacter tibetensis TaxID=497967 RepID=A0ABY4CVK9_9BACT|nr:T9SS type A sorting domain-containing protein [Hymenobacter tibetensis]UOG73509.1 T9SS type A sorting domain-containing protein [Hymenobacter tibetensis]
MKNSYTCRGQRPYLEQVRLLCSILNNRVWALVLFLLSLSGASMAQTFTENMGTTAGSRESIASYYNKRGFNNDAEKGFIYSGSAVTANSSTAVATGQYTGASGASTIYFGPAFNSAGTSLPDAPPYNFQIENINSAALTTPALTFGLYAPVTASIGTLNSEFTVEFSADGTNYITATYVAVTTKTNQTPANSGFTFNQYNVTSTIPRVNNLRVRFTRVSGNTNQYRLDDVALTAAAAPTITVAPTTLIFSNTTTGTQSDPQAITVSGQNLTNNINLSAPSGFLIRTGNNAYASSLTLAQTSGSVPTTTVDVVFAPTLVQAYSGNITLTSTNAQTRAVAVSGTGEAPAPILTASPTSLPDFGSVQVGLNSTTQSFTVSGSNLTNPVTLTVPAGFQMRQGTNAFSAANITLTPSSGSVNATIDIRFVPSQAVRYENTITVTSAGALDAGVDVSGTGTMAPTGPYITANPTSLNFQTVSSSGSFQTLTFEISAGNLTAPLVLTGSSGNIVFRDASVGGSFTSGPLTINPVSGAVSLRTIEVQLAGPVANGVFNGNITLTSTSAVSQVVTVTANNSIGGESTINSAGNLTQFSTVPGLASAVQSFQLEASNLLQDVTVLAPTHFQVSLDASFAGIVGTGNSIVVPRNTGGNDISPSVTVYVRFLPPTALTASSLIRIDSYPATSVGLPVGGTSEPSIQIQTVPQLISNTVINSTSASQSLAIRAERVQKTITISEALTANPLNPSNTEQFQISANNVDFGTTLTLTPNQGTFDVNQTIYFRYKPTYLGNAQSTLQFQSNDFTNTAAQVFGANDLLRANSIDTEPTLRSTATVTRNGTTATVSFNLPANYAALGYGEGRIIVASTNATLPAGSQPQDGNRYTTGNQTYGLGPEVAPGYYIVYSGANQTATVEGLSSSITYYFYTFEYNNIDNNFNISVQGAENYLSPPVPTVINGIEAPGGPLPVSLTSFTAILRKGQVALNWVTASESNNKGFEVQRSQDGKEFQTILTREGKGTTTNRSTYDGVDLRPLTGVSYYRLKQSDSDGKFAYSPVVIVTNAALAEITFYPNPTSGKLIVNMPQAQYTTATVVRVTDLSGREIKITSLSKDNEIDLSELKAGTYLLTLSAGDQQVTRRIIKN